MNKRHEKFKDSDFACKCGCGLGIDDMSPVVLGLLYNMRDQLNIPITITSAIRCEKHNTAIKGAPNSAHLGGFALDVKTATSNVRWLMVKWLLANGVRRIGINYKLNFIHFDTNPYLPQDVMFAY